VFGDKTLTGENELTWMAVVANILGDTQLFSVRLLTRGKSGVLHKMSLGLQFLDDSSRASGSNNSSACLLSTHLWVVVGLVRRISTLVLNL